MSSVSKAQRIRVYEYEFECHVTHCKVQVNFPCSFSLSWKTGNKTAEDQQPVKAIDDTIPFNSRLKLSLDMPFDENSQFFMQKKTLFCVNLKPTSNPSESRMVGVVFIDVASCLNTNNMSELKKYHLERCPDKSSFVMLSLKAKFIKELTPQEINKVSFSFPAIPQLSLQSQNTIQRSNNKTYDRAALKEKLGIIAGKGANTDRPKFTSPVSGVAPTSIQNYSSSAESKGKTVDQLQRHSTYREEIRALEKYEVKEPQNALTDRDKSSATEQLRSNIDNSISKNPSQRQQWLIKVQDNALQRKNQLIENSLREEITKLKSVCQSLDKELNSQHVFRIKLEVELQHTRVENLQLKQIEKNLQKELASLRPIEQQNAIRGMRRNLDRLQAENIDKAKRIIALQQQILNFTHVKLELAKKIQELSNKDDQEGQLIPCKSLLKLSIFNRNDSNKSLPVERSDNMPSSTNSQVKHEEISNNITNEAEQIRKLQLQNIKLLESNLKFKERESLLAINMNQLDESSKTVCNQLKENQAKIFKLQSQCFIYQQKIKELQGKHNSLLISQINESKNTIEAQSQTNAQEFISKSSIRSRLRSGSEQIQVLSQDKDLIIRYLQCKKDRVEASLQYFQDQNSHLQASLKQIRRKFNIMEKQLQIYRKSNGQCLGTIRSLSQQLIVKSVSALDVRGRYGRRESPELRISLQDDDTPRSQYTPPVKPVKRSEAGNLQKEVLRFKNQLHDSSNDLEQQRKKIDELIAQNTNLKKIIAEKEQEINDMTHRNELLQKSMRKFVSQQDSQQKNMAQLKNKITQLTTQLNHSQHSNGMETAMQKERSTLKQANDQLNRIIKLYEEKIEERQNKIIGLQIQLSQFKAGQKSNRNKKYQNINEPSQPEMDKSQIVQTPRISDSSQEQMHIEMTQLQQIIINLVYKNKQLDGLIHRMKFGFDRLLRQLSVQLNRVKVKMLNSSVAMEGKKLFVASLRPLQLKIEEILTFKDRVESDEHNIDVSDEQSEPVQQISEGSNVN